MLAIRAGQGIHQRAQFAGPPHLTIRGKGVTRQRAGVRGPLASRLRVNQFLERYFEDPGQRDRLVHLQPPFPLTRFYLRYRAPGQ